MRSSMSIAAHRFAAIFERLVVRAFRAEAAEHRQRDVLRPHAGLQPAFELDADRLRHAEPELARHHHGRDVGAFDAGAERIERAVSRRVRVGADDEIAAREMPAFGQDLMADAVADVVEDGAALVGEAAHRDVRVRSFRHSAAASSDRARTRFAKRTARPARRASRAASAHSPRAHRESSRNRRARRRRRRHAPCGRHERRVSSQRGCNPMNAPEWMARTDHGFLRLKPWSPPFILAVPPCVPGRSGVYRLAMPTAAVRRE